MAWNEPGSGNNKDDKKDPWSGKPSGGSPPDLEQALRNLHKKLLQIISRKQTGPKPNGGFPPLKINNMAFAFIGLIIFIAWFLWGFFIVDPAEQAVILRFGKFVRTVGPGPHWIPQIIEAAYLVNEQKISTYYYSAEMLTQDQNIVSVAVAVQYRIANARDYLFSVVNPQESLQQATASALRQVIGHTDLDEVLTSGREQIRQQMQTQLTNILSKYQTGLIITDVAMQPAKAPEEVKEAFDDAIKAQEDEQRFENQAQTYAMQVEPIAKGQAQRLLTDAKAYQQQAVLNAQANTAQFLALLPQYQNAPNITRERIYIETLQTILQNSSKILIDSNSNNNMFYVPLDKLITPSMKIPTPPIVATTPATTANVPPAASSESNDEDSARLQGGY